MPWTYGRGRVAAPGADCGSQHRGRHGRLKGADMQSKTVLIVDDELSILVPLQFLMEQNGFHVVLAQSGRDAFEALEKSKPDLILLDIMLPDLDGYEIFQMIRANPAWDGIKVIFLTAKNRDGDIAKGLNLGVDAYITKPFSSAELLAAVNDLLGLAAE
jgi:DNA-binding response OmpR family regulator